MLVRYVNGGRLVCLIEDMRKNAVSAASVALLIAPSVGWIRFGPFVIKGFGGIMWQSRWFGKLVKWFVKMRFRSG